jgi:hypothetical protein
MVLFPPAKKPRIKFAKAEEMKNAEVTKPTISTGACITSFM